MSGARQGARYYDMHGQQVGLLGACEIFNDPDARRVANTQLLGVEVSTVLLVFDHRHYDDGPPIIF